MGKPHKHLGHGLYHNWMIAKDLPAEKRILGIWGWELKLVGLVFPFGPLYRCLAVMSVGCWYVLVIIEQYPRCPKSRDAI